MSNTANTANTADTPEVPVAPAPPDGETPEQFRARARAWFAANLEPADPAARGFRESVVGDVGAQRALQRRLFDAGLTGITWPREYGGQGLGPEYERAFAEEARAYRLPDFGIVGGTTFSVCGPTMLAHGSPEFLRRHVPRILAGQELVVQFFSEPDAGSDLAGVRTQAVRRDGRWVLNGSKIWSSGAFYADYGLCLARTDWDVPKHRGLTWFAVPVGARGVTVQRIRQINGGSLFCQEFFDDVELTDDDVVGEVNNGWSVAQTMLIFERGGGVSHGGGKPVPKGIAPDLVELARSVGRLDDPAVRDAITREHVNDVARRALVARLGGLMRADPASAAHVASYAKLASGTYDPLRANAALRIGGADAVSWAVGEEGRTATAFLDGRFMSIAGGTNEMQRNGIGERVLGLPREPSFDSGRPFREVLRDASNWTGRVPAAPPANGRT